MIRIDDVPKNIYRITQFEFLTNSWSSIQNINSWRFWIWKNNLLLNLISHQPDTDKIYSYAKDPYEAEYQLSINKRESAV